MTRRPRPDPILLASLIGALTFTLVASAYLGFWFVAAMSALLLLRCVLDLQPVERLAPSRMLSQSQESAVWGVALGLLILLQFIATGDRVMLLFLMSLALSSLWMPARGLMRGRKRIERNDREP